MQKVLSPIVHKDAYTRAVECELLDWLRETIWTPLLIDLFNFDVPVSPQYQAIKYDETGRANAGESAVTRALMSGQIHYADGVFSGKFNAEISKELHELGALFNSESKTFRLAAKDLPAELTGAVVESLSQAKALHQQVIGTLDAIQANVVTKAISLNFTDAMDAITEDLNRQFKTSLVPVSGIESVTVQAEFTPAMRKAMTEQLTTNLDLSIKDFAAERIPVLRELVEKNALEGMRTDQLAKIIEAQFGVSKRKAAFLADQETGLATAKYRQLRYADLGVQEYIWSTSKDNRVRAGHRALEGRRFNFNSPPVCDPATGRRCNPGEDYRCRCVPKPIISFLPAIPET